VSDKPTVVEALAAVMEDVQSIRKGDRNTQQNFNFRGIDAVVNAVGPALRKHGVIVVPTGAHYDEQRYESRNGAQMRGVTTSVCYRFYGPAGDHIDANVLGEASDSGDKAIPKAFSVAYRTLLLQTLCVPTDEVDPDAQSHERVSNPQRLRARDEVLARNGSAGGDGASDRGKPSPTADDPHGLQASRADAVQPAQMLVTFGKHKGKTVSGGSEGLLGVVARPGRQQEPRSCSPLSSSTSDSPRRGITTSPSAAARWCATGSAATQGSLHSRTRYGNGSVPKSAGTQRRRGRNGVSPVCAPAARATSPST
jgi:hypothetical protein